jgi:hypothetical protein
MPPVEVVKAEIALARALYPRFRELDSEIAEIVKRRKFELLAEPAVPIREFLENCYVEAVLEEAYALPSPQER